MDHAINPVTESKGVPPIMSQETKPVSIYKASRNIITLDSGRGLAYEPVTSFAKLRTDQKSHEAAHQELLIQVDEYFMLVADTLYDNPEIQEDLLAQLQQAKERLQQVKDTDTDTAWLLSRAQFNVRRVHVAIAREQQAREEEHRLRRLVPALSILYIIVIFAVSIFGNKLLSNTDEKILWVPIIGVPLSVLVWATLGSLAAILYRFYSLERYRLSDEMRWLIARPVIGVIMGSLAYLVVTSGLFVFGGNTTEGPANMPLMWIVAFIGGFSDRFFNALINSVLMRLPYDQASPDQTTSQSQPNNEQIQQETTSAPAEGKPEA